MPNKTTYRTRAQEELLSFLKKNPGTHHTASQIRDHFAAEPHPIGMATIYRHLERFVEDGSVRKYVLGPGDQAYYAAFSGCSAESEASFATIAFLAGKVDELHLPAVLTLEGARHRIAQTVIQAASEKNLKVLTLNSMQGTTAADVRSGAAYLDIMASNLEVLKEALN